MASDSTSLTASTPAEWHQRKIHFNCRKIVSVVPEIVLVYQTSFYRRMLKHFAPDRFQLQENRLFHTSNRSGVPDFFLPQNVETFRTRLISNAEQSFLSYLKSFWCTRFLSTAEC